MNFKPNAWTVLFALALGAYLFNMYGSKVTTENEDADNNSCQGTQLDTIPPLEAFEMFSNYSVYRSGRFMDSLKATGVTNPDVMFFKIPKCELQEMVETFPNGEVIAYLGMKSSADGSSKSIDLFFSDKQVISNAEIKAGGDILAAKGAAMAEDVKFYDFTQPCPDSCNEK